MTRKKARKGPENKVIFTLVLPWQAQRLQHHLDVCTILMAIVNRTQKERFSIGFISLPHNNDELVQAPVCRDHQVGHLPVISNEANLSEKMVDVNNLGHGSPVGVPLVVEAFDSLRHVMHTQLVTEVSDGFGVSLGEEVRSFPSQSTHNIIEGPVRRLENDKKRTRKGLEKD